MYPSLSQQQITTTQIAPDMAAFAAFFATDPESARRYANWRQSHQQPPPPIPETFPSPPPPQPASLPAPPTSMPEAILSSASTPNIAEAAPTPIQTRHTVDGHSFGIVTVAGQGNRLRFGNMVVGLNPDPQLIKNHAYAGIKFTEEAKDADVRVGDTIKVQPTRRVS